MIEEIKEIKPQPSAETNDSLSKVPQKDRNEQEIFIEETENQFHNGYDEEFDEEIEIEW